MLPLALTTGEGEQLWGPMGKTALGGLLISSVVTLVLVPTMYVIIAKWQLEDAHQMHCRQSKLLSLRIIANH